MLMRAQFTRADLERAFDEFAERNGRQAALAVLAETAGTRDLAAVPEPRIIAAMAAFVGGYAFGGGAVKMAAQASSRGRLKLVHDKLNRIAQSVYAPKDRPDARS